MNSARNAPELQRSGRCSLLYAMQSGVLTIGGGDARSVEYNGTVASRRCPAEPRHEGRHDELARTSRSSLRESREDPDAALGGSWCHAPHIIPLSGTYPTPKVNDAHLMYCRYAAPCFVSSDREGLGSLSLPALPGRHLEPQSLFTYIRGAQSHQNDVGHRGGAQDFQIQLNFSGH